MTDSELIAAPQPLTLRVKVKVWQEVTVPYMGEPLTMSFLVELGRRAREIAHDIPPEDLLNELPTFEIID